MVYVSVCVSMCMCCVCVSMGDNCVYMCVHVR